MTRNSAALLFTCEGLCSVIGGNSRSWSSSCSSPLPGPPSVSLSSCSSVPSPSSYRVNSRYLWSEWGFEMWNRGVPTAGDCNLQAWEFHYIQEPKNVPYSFRIGWLWYFRTKWKKNKYKIIQNTGPGHCYSWNTAHLTTFRLFLIPLSHYCMYSVALM